MSTTASAIVIEILQQAHKCEMVGVPAPRPTEINIQHEKLFHLKDGFFGEDAEADEFLPIYLDVAKGQRSDLERLEGMVDEFCQSYLEALKPTAAPNWPQDEKPQIQQPQQQPQQVQTPTPTAPSTPVAPTPKKRSTGAVVTTPVLETSSSNALTPTVSAEDSEGSGGQKKRRGNLAKSATNLLKKWLFDHLVTLWYYLCP
jgi:hypothetical protein